MFLWGLISVLQTCILPGFILYNLFFGRTSFIKSLPYIFSLSLILNWIIVFYGSLLGIYEKNNLIILIVLEVIILIIISRKKINNKIKLSDDKYHKNYYLFTMLGNLVVAYSFLRVLPKLGRVFTMGDAIAYWNRCAIEWANNAIPTETMHYPQLLSSNYSVSYVLMGNTEIEFFAFAISAFFFPMASLAIYQLAKSTNNINFHIVNLIFCLYVSIFQEIAIGYADLPVACMSLIAFCALFNVYSNAFDKYKSIKFIYLSIILACGAAATKQSGVYYAIFHMFFCLYWVYKNYNIKIFIKFLLYLIIINIIIYGFWYIFAQNQINNGLSSSEITYVTKDIFEGKNLIQRTYYAFLNWPYFYFMALGSLVALTNSRLRVICTLTIAYVVIWSFYFSYDRRNFALALPFLAINIGLSYQIIFDKYKIILDKIRLKYFSIFFALVVISISMMVPNTKLLEFQKFQKVKWNSKI